MVAEGWRLHTEHDVGGQLVARMLPTFLLRARICLPPRPSPGDAACDVPRARLGGVLVDDPH